MKTLKIALPLVLHLVLVAVIVVVWEEVPHQVGELTTHITPPLSGATTKVLEYAAVFVVLIAIVLGFEWLSSRRLLVSLARDKLLRALEGEWVQRTDIKERPLSVGFIRFDAALEHWEYSGVGFDENGAPAATWETFSLRYDGVERTWYFAGVARILEGEHKDARYTVVPMLRLPRSIPDRPSLTGTVADIGVGGVRQIFDIKNMRPVPGGTVRMRLSSTDAIRSLSPDDVHRIAKLLE